MPWLEDQSIRETPDLPDQIRERHGETMCLGPDGSSGVTTAPEPNGGKHPRPDECPKWNTCNASVCPLQFDWPKAVHLKGEWVCPYLLRSGKAGSAKRYANDPIFEACNEQLRMIGATYPDIARRIRLASKSGFRGANLSKQLD